MLLNRVKMMLGFSGDVGLKELEDEISNRL